MLSRFNSAIGSSIFRNVGSLSAASLSHIGFGSSYNPAIHFSSSTAMRHIDGNSRAKIKNMFRAIEEKKPKFSYPSSGISNIKQIVKQVNSDRTFEICKEAARLIGVDPAMFRENLATFFIQGNKTMQKNYDNSFLKFAIGIRDGITKAITFSDDRCETKEELMNLYKNGEVYRQGVALWDFLNVTGRPSHLYGLKEEGFFYYEDVKGFVERYNRFGLHGKDEDSTFQLLTRKETRELIRNGELTPLDALCYAEQLRLDPNADNILKDVYHKILSSNHKRGAAFGITC